MLVAWAEQSRRAAEPGHGRLRFAFYGRVSTEDWQDPVTSRARQREQAAALVAGHGAVVAEFFDAGESRTLAWARRPQAAALVAALADPDRGWDAIVIGEYERAFYGGQYASMAPLFAHYGVKLWLPEAGGPVGNGEDHEQLMLALGLQSKREVTRTRIRVRTAMATQTREQGRYLGGRPPYGYRLADAGPHPNKAPRRLGPPGNRSSRDSSARAGRGVDVRAAAFRAQRRAAQRARRHEVTCWPGCSPAAGADGGWNLPGRTASPPTGADTATPALPAQSQDGRRTPTSARIRSCRACPPWPSSWTATPRQPAAPRRSTAPRETAALIDQLRTAGIILTYDPDTRTLRTGDSSIAAVTVGRNR